MFDFSEINKKSFNELSAINDTLFDVPNPLQNKLSINYEEFIRNLNVIEGNKVLEIGCGTGDLALYLGNCGYNVTAIDFADKMLIAARNKLRIIKENIQKRKEIIKNSAFMKQPSDGAILSSVNPKVRFVSDDITNLKNISEKFNIVSLVNTLSYIPENKIKKVYENISEITYKGGIVTFLFSTELNYKNRKNIQKSNQFFNYEIVYEHDELEKIIKTNVNIEKNNFIENSMSLNFYEKIYPLEFLNEILKRYNFQIIKILPDTPIYVSDAGNIDEVIAKINATYMIPNGVNNVVIAAQKL